MGGIGVTHRVSAVATKGWRVLLGIGDELVTMGSARKTPRRTPPLRSELITAGDGGGLGEVSHRVVAINRTAVGRVHRVAGEVPDGPRADAGG